jgi:hypothetical protein
LVEVVAEITVRHLILDQDFLAALVVEVVVAQELKLVVAQQIIQDPHNKVILVVLRPLLAIIVAVAVALELLEQQHQQLAVLMVGQDILGRILV